MGKSVAFLCGAGCEGKNQLDFPSGANFKKDIVLAKNIKTLYEKINSSGKFHENFSNGAIIDARCSTILYQTFVEHVDLLNNLSNEVKKIIENYISYRKGNKENDSEKKEIQSKFKELYKSFIGVSNSCNISEQDRELFFGNITLCSFSDELFNYLRMPEVYKTEVSKVEKLYFSAYLSILKSIYKTAHNKDFEKDYLCSSVNDKKQFRVCLEKDLEEWQNLIIRKNCDNKNLYYETIREKKAKYDFEGSVITTNYTNFAEKITGLKTAYLHGKLDWFEDINSKEIKLLSDFSDEAEIMPFLFIPSGVKPVISLKQIEQYKIALEAFTQSDLLCILGYSINSDDEHIQNFIRERLNQKRRVLFFLYSGDKDFTYMKNDYCAMFGNSQYLEIKKIEKSQDFRTGLENALKAF